MAFAGINMWWFVGNYGVRGATARWRSPGSTSVGSFWRWPWPLLSLGLFYHFRDDYVDEKTRTGPVLGGPFRFAPLPTVAALVVLFMVASLAKGAWVQRDSWSWTKSNYRAMTGNECALANDVLVAADPTKGILLPAAVGGRPAAPVADGLGAGPGFRPTAYRRTSCRRRRPPTAGNCPRRRTQVHRRMSRRPAARGAARPARSQRIDAAAAVRPEPAHTPVLGSYGATGPAALTTGWYQLPFNTSQPDTDRPLVTVAVAGSVQAVDIDNAEKKGQSVLLEFGRRRADGSVVAVGRMFPLDAGEAPAWRDLRFPLDKARRAMRTSCASSLTTSRTQRRSGWPSLRRAWTGCAPSTTSSGRPTRCLSTGCPASCSRASGPSRCATVCSRYRCGASCPRPTRRGATARRGWPARPADPGITEALLRPTLMPTYLRNNWGRDWGGLQRFTEIEPAPPATLVPGTTRESGLWDLAPMRSTGY